MPQECQIYLINLRMFELIKKITIVVLSMLLVFFVMIFVILWTFSNDLPNYKFLLNYEPPVSSRVHAGDGQLIAEFALQKDCSYLMKQFQKMLLIHFFLQKTKIFLNILVLMLKGLRGQ